MKRILGMLVTVTLFLTGMAFAHGGSHKKVKGTITSADRTMLMVQPKAGAKDVHVKLGPDTRYTLGKKSATSEDVKTGMRVVVSLAPDGMTAEVVELGSAQMPAPAPAHAASPTAPPHAH